MVEVHGQLYVNGLGCLCYKGLVQTIYIRCINVISGKEITKYTFIYGVYIIYTVMANPIYIYIVLYIRCINGISGRYIIKYTRGGQRSKCPEM